MSEQLTSDLLTLYGFRLAPEPTTGQGGDTYIREGVALTEIEGSGEFVYGKGADKRLLETFDDLNKLWKEKKGVELNLSA